MRQWTRRGGEACLLSLGLLVLLWGCSNKRVPLELNPEELFGKALHEYEKENYRQAVLDFQQFIFNFPGSPLEDKARFFLADAYFKDKEYLLATQEFQYLGRNFPYSPLADDAFFKAAQAYEVLSLRPELDQEDTRKAIGLYQTLMATFPQSELVPEANSQITRLEEKLARKRFLNAKYYYDLEFYESAVIYLRELITDYPRSSYVPESYYYLHQCYRRLGNVAESTKIGKALLQLFPDSAAAQRLRQESDKAVIE